MSPDLLQDMMNNQAAINDKIKKIEAQLDKTSSKTNSGDNPSSLDTFMSETSLHGCKNITSDDRNRMSKLSWGIIVLGSLAFLLYILFQLLELYLEHSFTTQWSLRKEERLTAPSLKICLMGYGSLEKSTNVEDPLLRYYFAVEQDRDMNKSAHLEQILAQTPYSEIFYRVTFETQDVIKFIHIWSEDSEGSLDVTSAFRRSFVDSYTFPQRKRECWLFNTVDEQGKGGSLQMRKGEVISIGIEPKSKMMTLEPKRSGIMLELITQQADSLGDMIGLRTGSENYVTFSKTEMKFLPPPYDSLKPVGCVENSVVEDKYKLLSTPVYTQQECENEKLYKAISNQCNCALYPFNKYFNISECTASVEGYGCFMRQYSNLTLLSSISRRNPCPLPCFYNTFLLDVSSVDITGQPDYQPNISSGKRKKSQFWKVNRSRKNN